jgi:MoaA/NifB/PqqE/SkfB family radical SAM enzyme
MASLDLKVLMNNQLSKFNLNLLEEFQIEITTFCNAACPQCPRNINGDGLNPYMPLTHLSLEAIKNAFAPQHVKRLRQIFFCGSYGDPIMHPKFLEILEYFRSCSDSLWLYAHTNGGVHDKEYWYEVAKIIGKQGKIDFGIDGLADTNHLYRQNVHFEKVIENASAFIQKGGKAQWNYIVFEHNQHQVQEAKEMSVRLGFESFVARNTGRFFDHKQLSEIKLWPVFKRGVHNRNMAPTTLPEYQNKSINRLPDLKSQYEDMKDYFETTKITCDALLGKKVVVTGEGLVLPCNFFNHNLYDMRFHESALPFANSLSFNSDGKNQVEEFIERYGKDNLNINNKSLQEIFDNPFWNDLISTWDKNFAEGRIFECAMTCGKGFTKVWDQSTDNLPR